MHIVNRILVILGLLAIMVVSAILFLAWGPFLQILISMLQQADAALNAVANSNPLMRWAGGFGLTVLVWAVCIALLWLETRRPRARTITVQRVSGGLAELTVDSIISRLQYNLEQLPDIIRVWPRVRSARKGVRIDMAVETNPEVEVPAITEEIRQRTRDILEQQMGLKLESMRVVIRHAPYPKSFFKGERVEALPRPTTTASHPTASPAAAPPAGASPVVTPPPPQPFETPSSQPVAESTPSFAPPAAEPPRMEPPATQMDAEAGVDNNRDRPSHRPWSFLQPRGEEVASAPAASEAALPEGDAGSIVAGASADSPTDAPSGSTQDKEL